MTALAQIWAALGGDEGALRRVSIEGPDHVLPSVFQVTELASAAVAAATLGAARLSELHDSRPRQVAVDRRHAAIAFRSERHFKVNGEFPPPAWDAASGYFETADGGLLQVHCNFPHHRAGLLTELGLVDPGDRDVADAIRRAVAGRDAQELEDALAQRGMVAARLQTPEQWADHPHGRAVASLPLIEILPIGTAPVQALPCRELPLGGVRVADLTRVIAGPVCGRTLAAFGADVLRVGAAHLPVISPILGDTNLGKRWANVDLRCQAGAAQMRELFATCDVVVQGYRPGGLDMLGFSPKDIAALRPGVVVASLSAYSHVGPWSGRRGFDSLVQTATGIGSAGARAAGLDETKQTKPLPAQALDHGAGWLLAAGVAEALRRRATIGGSWLVRTSLLQVRNFLVGLGQIDALDVPDPANAIEDLLTTTRGSTSVEHVAFPGVVDTQAATWSRTGSTCPTDALSWL